MIAYFITALNVNPPRFRASAFLLAACIPASYGFSQVELPPRVVIHSDPLPASEKLALVFSKSTDSKGKSRQVLVFLGRANERGWEAIGNGNTQELRNHWRKAAARSFGDVRQLELSIDDRQKLDLAIEFTIARFIRIYEDLQSDLDIVQRDQNEVLNDERYSQLTKIATTGLFDSESLAVRVANEITAKKLGKPADGDGFSPGKLAAELAD